MQRWLCPVGHRLHSLGLSNTEETSLTGGGSHVYNSNESSKLPFSTISESQFRSTNDNNIQLLRDSKRSQSTFGQILTGEQWQTKYIDEAFKFTGDNSLLGGGPDGNVVALYLSGYVLAEREGKNTNLATIVYDAKPFSEQDPSGPVSLEKALERILQAVAPSSKIWVTLMFGQLDHRQLSRLADSCMSTSKIGTTGCLETRSGVA